MITINLGVMISKLSEPTFTSTSPNRDESGERKYLGH